VSDLAHRTASLSDMKEIWSLLRQAAADIPLPVESDADQERALTEIMECVTSELSPVVVEGKQIVGVLLAKRDLLDWGLSNVWTINVAAAAVSASHRDRGAFKILFDQLIKSNAPVYVGVKSGDGQGLTDQLKSSGFSVVNVGAQGDVYKWEPPAPAAKAA
jgi:hypothetical protein